MPAMGRRERPVIGFLTDFGLDGAAATCRGVMLGICRDAQIVDISHTVRKYAVRDGAYLLRASLPYLPVGVHVAVIDPQVGTTRRPIALLTGRGDLLVGPDNGLLVPPAQALGGLEAARELTNRELWRPGGTSSTFHGRDIFAPVAAHLAAGTARFEDVGVGVRPEALVQLDPGPTARAEEGALATAVVYVDSFGNLRLAGGLSDVETAIGPMDDGRALVVEFGNNADRGLEPTVWAATFGRVPPGNSLLYLDSLGGLALADNQGNAAARLGIGPETPVRIRSG
jgi:S-adenosyl-L-methionine hydrolase (adenosine-forming)